MTGEAETIPGSWYILCHFKDGCSLRERSYVNGDGVTVLETRIFNADGTLRPLPDGRRSLADKE